MARSKRTKTQPSAAANEDRDAHENSVGSATDAATADSLHIDDPVLDEEEIPREPTSPASGQPVDTSGGRRGGTYAGASRYNEIKSFNGQIYSGMAVGGSHTWNYDPGVWHETKEEPDLWKIDYKTHKRRASTAPKGSGAPVGTEYHWLIVAHQYVKKEDANTYETHLVGSKYKLAHKAASSNSWSVPTVKGQRERELELLEDAGRRIQGLPPVLRGEKVRVEKHERGQQKLDTLFQKVGQGTGSDGKKRKREEEENPDDM
ncbi:hypothetical protein QBC33DRAFT_538663 [Phialemonium atrogriseum]|uniref:Uncharacterized protein n=1 Tax=Phialemonium atrogriseum TaxID=1093897 RepID=A0AAJ0BZX6_9PEZI|nr:uncharacterized protein QBC33DRAFT_538663 [Phialemonium atrogriseum]KAK1767574.1 hypothetical protein QBC33DRAFT_538663 [Phialemonium atrogriseum]